MIYMNRCLLVICLAGLFIILLSSGCARKTPVLLEHPADEISDRFVENADGMAKDGQYKTSNFFYKKAIANYEKLEIWEKAIRCYIKLGDNYQKLEDVKTALGTLNRALDLTENHLGYKHLELAKSFQKLAFKYFRVGNLDQALELYQKALAIQLDVLGKNHPDVSKTYNSIALVYLNKKQPVDANKNYIKSYSIKFRQMEGMSGEMKARFQSAEQMLDFGEANKEEIRKARERFNRSIAEYRKLYGQNKPLFAEIFEHIGILHAFEGNFDGALENLRKALDIRLEVFGVLGPEAGTSYLNIGICLRLKGDHEEALNFLNSALAIKIEHRGEFHPDTADIYCQMGKVLYQRNQLDEALVYFQKSLMALVPGFEDSRFSVNPPLDTDTVVPADKLLDILTAKANTLRMQYILYPDQLEDLRAAYSTYFLLSRLVEKMRRGYKSESYKLFFGEKVHTIYQQAIQTALLLFDMTQDPQYREAAFVLSEKSKAAVLAEALSETRAKQFAGIPVKLLEKEKKLKEELTHYDTYLQKEYYKEAPDAFKIKNLENRYHTLMLEYRQLIGHFETNYRKYYDLKYKPHVVNIPGIQRTLAADPETALVEYFIGENVIHIYVLTGDGLEVVDLALDEDLNQMVDTYNRSIKKIEERPFLELSRKLYRMLLEPVRHLLAGKKKLIVIPDGGLYTIPFESLTGGASRSSSLSQQDFMIKHFAFSYHYSANLWLYSVDKSTPGKKKEVAFIGFAPVFDRGTQDSNGYILIHDPARDGQDRPGSFANLRGDGDGESAPLVSQLPATEEELQAIVRLFKSQRKKAAGYFRRKATEDNFKTTDMQGYNLIHIATHSLKDEGEHKLSGLIFSQGADNPPGKEDGILYSGEIYNLRLGAELIVLSSCESGVGKLVKGEGVMALNRGFFYSGIRNIVFSLWKVEDRTTSKLMIAFYRNILNGLPFSSALRKAKLELINDRFTAFPKYWSGFVLVGK